MKVALLLVVVLTAMFTANCRDQVNNIEDQLFSDEPGEDYTFPSGQVDEVFIGEVHNVSMGSENQNIDEEVQQMNENFDMGSVADHTAPMSENGKKCVPTTSCTQSGGYCVKRSGDCNGRLDRNGCKGNNNCQCCIPDATTTVPSTTTTPSTTTISGKKCVPTTSCTQAGGYCVKKRGDCNGRLDRKGCKGNKKCQCCIPDTSTTIIRSTTTASITTTSGKKCVPTTSCIRAGGHCVKKTGDCDGRLDRKGCKGNKNCQCCIPGCSSPWITLGENCYLFGQIRMSWATARTYCGHNGGQLAILNTEAKRIAVTDYLVSSTPSDDHYWLGGSNLSGSWVFVDNSTVTSDVWNVASREPDAGPDACMYTSKEFLDAGEFDLILDTTCYRGKYSLCEK